MTEYRFDDKCIFFPGVTFAFLRLGVISIKNNQAVKLLSGYIVQHPVILSKIRQNNF